MKLFRLGCVALFCAAPILAAGQGVELKLGHVGEPGSLVGAAADEFARRVNAQLSGRYKVVARAAR